MRPISTPRMSNLASNRSTTYWSTPKNAKELRDQIYQSNLVNQDTPTQRLLFQKVFKAFDKNNIELATAQARIQALEGQSKGIKPRKRKRVETSLNSKFTSIKDVQRAQINDLEITISSDGNSDIETKGSIALCIEVDLDVEEIKDQVYW